MNGGMTRPARMQHFRAFALGTSFPPCPRYPAVSHMRVQYRIQARRHPSSAFLTRVAFWSVLFPAARVGTFSTRVYPRAPIIRP